MHNVGVLQTFIAWAVGDSRAPVRLPPYSVAPDWPCSWKSTQIIAMARLNAAAWRLVTRSMTAGRMHCAEHCDAGPAMSFSLCDRPYAATVVCAAPRGSGWVTS